MNILWEAMVTEMRAERLEADNRRHFTPEKQSIELIREQLAGWTEQQPSEDPEMVALRSASAMRQAADDDLFELG